MDAPVLLCASSVWERHRDAIETIAPGVHVVSFRAGQRVSSESIERITIAYSSGDLYPEATPAFMRVCLEAPRLEWMQVFSAGVDHPVFGMVRSRGTRLTTASGSAATPIAHHVLMSVLALAHDLPGFLRDQHQRAWSPRQIDDVEGRTMGVLGMGPIGAEVARLATAFGMRVIGMRRTVTGDEPCETWTFDRLHELLPLTDHLVLALPLTADTRTVIGDNEFALLPRGARVVNVGRGELIDEAALASHLRTGHLGGAALDVFAVEPLPPDSELWAMPNVIITPHTSGETRLAAERVDEIFLDNLGRYVRGERLRNEIA